jgi:hypothetical protein
LYKKRSPAVPESTCPWVVSGCWAGEETKSTGADDGSIIAGDGTKNCGVPAVDNDGVTAGNASSSGKGLLTELILMLDGLT